MTTAIRRRRGTTVQHSTFTGLDGEVTVDTTKKTLVVHDGSTAGGMPLLPKTMSDGTANGVAYLNGSKVLTTGSALTYNGTSLSAPNFFAPNDGWIGWDSSFRTRLVGNSSSNFLATVIDNAEQMRLTSTGLVIGASSSTYKLDVFVTGNNGIRTTSSAGQQLYLGNTGGDAVVGTLNNYSLGLLTNGSVRATLDSSGNLGLGVTPSAHAPSAFGGPIFQVSLAGILGSTTDNILAHNTYYATGAYRYIASSTAATRFDQTAGAFRWLTAASGTAGDTITFTQAMTLDASGNLGVGVTNPAVRLDVQASRATSRVTSTTGTNAVDFQTVNTGGQLLLGIDNSAGSSLFGSGAYAAGLWYTGAYPLVFGTNNTERARITSGGDLLVGTQSAGAGISGVTSRVAVVAATSNFGGVFVTDAAAYHDLLLWNKATSGDNAFVEFATEGTYTGRGSITYNRAGGLVAYNTTSDYRAKDIIGPVANPGATIDALKVYSGKMKGATVERPMLVAHEAQAVTPYAVTGEKDAVNDSGDPIFQQMDVSSLVPLLIAEIQSLRQRVAQLEGA